MDWRHLSESMKQKASKIKENHSLTSILLLIFIPFSYWSTNRITKSWYEQNELITEYSSKNNVGKSILTKAVEYLFDIITDIQNWR